MASGKGRFLRLLSGVLLKKGAILDAEGVGGLRRLVVRAEVPPFAFELGTRYPAIGSLRPLHDPSTARIKA
jgi:hypothetical protein